jgi:hypothetical protein
MLRQHTIVWKDNPDTEIDVLFYVGDFTEDIDERIFYYVEDEEDLDDLKDPAGVEDFYIIK